MKLRSLILSCICLQALVQCTFKEPEYTANFVVPVFKSGLGPEDLTALLPVVYTDTFTSTSLPYNPSLAIPADTALQLGPFEQIDTASTYLGFSGRNVRVRVTIENNLPMDFASGVRFILVNISKRDSVVDARFPFTIPGRGARLIHSFGPLPSAFFNDDVRIILSEIRHNGTSSPPDYTLYNGLTVKVELLPEEVTEYFVATLRTFTLQDTVPFSFSDNESFMKASDAEVQFSFVNAFPASLRYQAFFLDENKAVLDSALSNRSVLQNGALLDTSGFSVPGSSTQTVVRTNYSERRLEAIRRTRYLASVAAFRTPVVTGSATPSIVLRPFNRLEFEVTTRMNVLVRNNNP
jgi:hypothetical protein